MNELHEIYDLQSGGSLAFCNKTDIHDIYQEAYQNNKIITHLPGLMAPTIVVTCIDPRVVKGTDLSKWLCLALKNSEDKKVFTKIPDHLSAISLQTTLYRIAGSFGIKAKVILTDNHIVLQLKEKKSAPAPKSTKTMNTRLPHAISKSTLFKKWVDSLSWDTPTPIPATADRDYYTRLASKHYCGSVKVRHGVLTKHSLCLGKSDGLVCVLNKGNIIFTTLSRSLLKLTESDRAGINLALTPFGKTYEDIR